MKNMTRNKMKRTILETLIIGLALGTLAGCGGERHPDTTPAEASESAPPGPVTSRTSPDSLPEGHPPVTGSGSSSIVPPPPGSGTGTAGLYWEVPEGWIEERPSSGMRRAQYRVPGPDGDSECVVFYFGPGQGGDPMSNALRWAGQFSQPDGRDSAEVLKTTTAEVAGMPVLMVEITGTYANLMVNDEELPDYMLLGAIAPGADANWFFKLTGPQGSVRAQREQFEELTGSIRAGAM